LGGLIELIVHMLYGHEERRATLCYALEAKLLFMKGAGILSQALERSLTTF
jgi:hypothetical protein